MSFFLCTDDVHLAALARGVSVKFAAVDFTLASLRRAKPAGTDNICLRSGDTRAAGDDEGEGEAEALFKAMDACPSIFPRKLPDGVSTLGVDFLRAARPHVDLRARSCSLRLADPPAAPALHGGGGGTGAARFGPAAVTGEGKRQSEGGVGGCRGAVVVRIHQELSSLGIGAVVWDCALNMCRIMHTLPEFRKYHNRRNGDSHDGDGGGGGQGESCDSGSVGDPATRAAGTAVAPASGAFPGPHRGVPTCRLRVLDLGSGTGLVGLMAALLGAGHVVLSDVPEVVPLILRNVQQNAALLGPRRCARVQVVSLPWGRCPPPYSGNESRRSGSGSGSDSGTGGGDGGLGKDAGRADATKPQPQQSPFAGRLRATADVVFASDCLYDAVFFDDLRETLLRVTRAGSVVYLAYQVRHPAREEAFFESLKASGKFEAASIQLYSAAPAATAFAEALQYIVRCERVR